MNYFDQKEEYKTKAVKHTEEMDKKFSREIQRAISESIIYGGPDKTPCPKNERQKPSIFFLNTDSVSALKKSKLKKAVLNFASYKNPGGMFMQGSKAQEEMLCHSSFLYNILRTFKEYYKWNNEHKNRALYTDRAIFSPNISFGDTICDVITCAAPNIGVGKKYSNVSDDENKEVLHQRMKFIRDVAEENDIETLIIGAFGCGVFKQDPEDVCRAIDDAFNQTSIKNIVIAVPGKDHNYKVFSEHFKKE